MRHLKDEVRARGLIEQRLLELVRSAEPFRPNPFSKRLVLLRIRRNEKRPRSHFLLRGALIGGLLFGGTATALGAFGYGLFQRDEPEPKAAPKAPANANANARRRAPAAPRAEAPPAAEELAPSAEPSLPSDAVLARPSPARAETRRGAKRRAEDPSQVVDAIRALRKEHDAARAQALLDDYLAAQPRGALSEDALALAIEAAAARRDPRAADYARRYLARYPNGRFRAVAERAAGRR